MRKLSTGLVAVVLAFAAAACDSNEEDLSDLEILVGSWTVVEVSDTEGDKTAIFEEGVQNFTATLNVDGSYSMLLDFVEPARPDIPLQGDYILHEGPNELELHATLLGNPVVLPFEYRIETEDRVDLLISDELVEPVFGTQPDTYVGTITFTIARD
jgi:hypothetical protein